MSLIVQVLPDQLQEYQNKFEDLQAVLMPGCAGADGQVAMARARCLDGAHLVVFDDNIASLKVNNASMQPGDLRKLINNAWKYMKACKSGAWSINISSNLWSKTGQHPLQPLRFGLNLVYGALSGQIVNHIEEVQLCVRHGQIMDDVERSLRTYSLYPEGGILIFYWVTVYKKKQGRPCPSF